MRRLMLGSFSNCKESEKEGLEVLKEWRPVYGLLDGAKKWPWSVWQQLFTFVTISVVRCFSLLFPLLRPSSNASFFWNMCVRFQMLPPSFQHSIWVSVTWKLDLLLYERCTYFKNTSYRSTGLCSMYDYKQQRRHWDEKFKTFILWHEISNLNFSPLILWSLTQNNPEKTILKQKVEHQPTNDVEIECYLTADLKFAIGVLGC